MSTLANRSLSRAEQVPVACEAACVAHHPEGQPVHLDEAIAQCVATFLHPKTCMDYRRAMDPMAANVDESSLLHRATTRKVQFFLI